MRFPGERGGQLLSTWVRDSQDGDDRTWFVSIAMALLATLWMAIPVGIWAYWPALGNWHDAAMHGFMLL